MRRRQEGDWRLLRFCDGLDSDSGPYLMLMAAAIRLARRDLDDRDYSAGARDFLGSELALLFAECIGYEGSWDA